MVSSLRMKINSGRIKMTLQMKILRRLRNRQMILMMVKNQKMRSP